MLIEPLLGLSFQRRELRREGEFEADLGGLRGWVGFQATIHAEVVGIASHPIEVLGDELAIGFRDAGEDEQVEDLLNRGEGLGLVLGAAEDDGHCILALANSVT